MLASPQIKTINLLTTGVVLNFSSFGRNCYNIPWLGCFKSMLAYMIHSQNTKNPSCVGTYVLVLTWYL